MPRKTPESPAIDSIEQDFLSAIKRLQDGAPTHKSLKVSKAKGTLKINATNVALEAGHSRTLIAMDRCRYPRVREMLRLAKAGTSHEPRTHTELIARLRAEVADLRGEVKLYQAEATAHFIARQKAEREAENERAAKARILRAQAEASKIVSLNQKN